jgi:hypothetical protein
MNLISIGSATDVYETASHCEIIRHCVDHITLANVSCSLRTLAQSLGAEADDDFWQRVLGPIRRLAFAMCSTPLPFELIPPAVSIDWDKLHRQVRLCEQLYPDSHTVLARLVQDLQNLSTETGSPITAPLESLHSTNRNMSVVLRNPRMNQPVAAYFAASPALRDAKVVSAQQLRKAYFCDVLVAIGPCGWFPEYMFSAPRAEQIHVVSFRWIRDQWKPGPVFLSVAEEGSDRSPKHNIGALPHLRDQDVLSNQTLPNLQPLDLLPPLPPFGKAGARIPGWQQGTSNESLPARLCFLSGGRAVFVSNDEGTSSLVIDSAETGNSIVRRVPSGELEPDLYLLLRTSGGGEFIAPLADRILGELASERRKQQTEWKELLISAAEMRFGIQSRRELAALVARDLRSKAMSTARAENVHYWMSSKCIRPRKKDDLAAILVFAGIQDRTQELWEAMGNIDWAHKKAGQVIRKMLLQRITALSLEPLERDGEMVFDLGDQDGGSFSAFQIVGISEEEFDIPADRIGVLLDSEE